MGRIFNTPLMIHEPKLDVILWALHERLNIVVEEPEAPAKYWQGVDAKSEIRTSNSGSVPAVAVIPVHDTLVNRHTMMQSYSGMTSYLYIRNEFRRAMSRDEVSAVVLHIDSPGGEVSGARELAQEIYSARGNKPIYAAVDEYAFSAAYYIAAATDRIFVPKSGGVGSIGVIARHLDQSQWNEKEGYRVTTVYAGARKNDLSPYDPISEEALTTLQDLVNDTYDMFSADVAAYRGVTQKYIKGTEAALYWGDKAVAAGLADEIGNLDNAITAAIDASAKPRIARNIKGILPDRKENKMERFQSLAELVAEYPQFAAELREEGKNSADIAVTAEVERILGLANVHFGAEAGKAFDEIVRSGITVEQYQTVIPKGTTAAQLDATWKEEQAMGQLLRAITAQTGKQNPGMGGEDGRPTDFLSLVAAYRDEHGCSRSRAISAIARSHPGEHAEYLRAAQNGGK